MRWLHNLRPRSKLMIEQGNTTDMRCSSICVTSTNNSVHKEIMTISLYSKKIMYKHTQDRSLIRIEKEVLWNMNCYCDELMVPSLGCERDRHVRRTVAGGASLFINAVNSSLRAPLLSWRHFTRFWASFTRWTRSWFAWTSCCLHAWRYSEVTWLEYMHYVSRTYGSMTQYQVHECMEYILECAGILVAAFLRSSPRLEEFLSLFLLL